MINWNPGVRGGIPDSRSIYTTLPASATTKQIQTALSNCPVDKIVRLSAGTYVINDQLKIPSGVTLKGAGMNDTIIKGVEPALYYVDHLETNSITGVVTEVKYLSKRMILFNDLFDYTWSAYPAINLDSPQKDSHSLNTLTSHGWSVGDYLIIDTKTNEGAILPVSNYTSAGTGGGGISYPTWLGRENGTRPCGQVVKITNVLSSTSVQIDPPLYFSYTNQPQGVKIGPMIEGAGLEDLTLDNLDSSSFDNIVVQGAVNSWVKDVKIMGIKRRAVWVYNALWFEFRGVYMTGGIPIGSDRDLHYTSDRAYPIFFGPHCSASLITDTISDKLTIGGICWEGNASGNVFSYNFMTNIWWYLSSSDSDLVRRYSMLMHGGHPFMNLMEGNYSASGLRADEYWGTSSHFTALRNRIFSQDRGNEFIDGQCATIDIQRRNQYWTFVGNLIGGTTGSAEEKIYEVINLEYFPYDSTRTTIWKLGYIVNGIGTTVRDIAEYDPYVLSTAIRWGNWCYRTNDLKSGSGMTWHEDNVTHNYDKTIPKSYYLAEKPEFFGDLEWPPYDPYQPTKNEPTRIPAGYRFYYGTNAPTRNKAASYSAPAIIKRENTAGPKDRIDF